MASGSEANRASSSMATQNIDLEQAVASGMLPSKHDLTRAMACSMAISDRDKSEEYLDAFRKLEPEDQFQEIHLSDESEEQQFLVAYAEDAVFIGFRGTRVLQDVACDLLVQKISNRHIPGSFHKGIYERSSCVFGLHGSKIILFPLLKLILTEGKRIIFCGHSLGGAVGHMVLIRLLLEKEDHDPKNDDMPLDDDNMISIAFGAPHLCDKIAADLINGNPTYKNRFVTFVNRQDFVPRLLHEFPSNFERISLGFREIIADVTNIEWLGTAAYKALNSFQGSGQKNIRDDPIPDLSDGSCEHLFIDLANLTCKGRNDFKAIGNYVFLESKEVKPAVISSTSNTIDEYLCKLQVQQEVRVQHECLSYFKTLVASSLIRKAPVLTPEGKGPSNSSELSAQSPTKPKWSKPEVIEAKTCLTDELSYNFELSGKNFLFLREVKWKPVKRDLEISPYNSAHDKLTFKSKPLSKQEQQALRKSGGLGTVTIKTAFGSCDFKIKKPPSVSEISKLLPELVQKVGQLDSLGNKLTEEQQERLDNILRCHAPAWGRSYPDGTEEVMEMVPLSRFAEAREVIRSVEATVEFVQNSSLFKFQLQEGVSHLDAADNYKLGRIKFSVALFSFSETTANRYLMSVENTRPIDIGESCFRTLDDRLDSVRNSLRRLNSLDRFYSKFVTFNLADVQSTLNVCIKNYEDMLQVAVRLINDFNERGNCNEGDRKSTQRFTEDDLVKAVDGADENVKAWLRAAVSSSSTEEPTARSGLRLELPEGSILRGATEDSIRTFFKKIYAIVETKKLYRELDIGGKCFVAVFGEEDSGKSSFIQKVLGIELPDVGGEVHTSKVNSYKAENGMFLVDYPGSNGAEEYADWWRQYLHLPTLVVLILAFNGDIKQNYIDLYKTTKAGIPGCPILVAFNKVDEKINSRTKQAILKLSYFEGHKEKVIKKLKCTEETVFFTAFDPPEENLIYMEDLMSVGVLDHKAFMEKVNLLCPNLTSSE
ncbi:hypothetical protein M758_11G155500 [Ceratodon purpureus]|nr:hypothetical protein M758_11G155500 [Ceratodon purpureus]